MTLGRGRIRAITGHLRESLTTGWSVACTPPGAVSSPHDLASVSLDWVTAHVPSTAAETLAAAGRWSLDRATRDFDAEDWWYRTTFAATASDDRVERWLAFEGLATIADVWLNGEELLSARGMFTSHHKRVESLLRENNELVLCFRSLGQALSVRRPRPRWRVPMLEQQQLRWHRTTLLGRTPGWSPRASAVGPWRPVTLECRTEIHVDDVRLRAECDGTLDVSCIATELDGRCVIGVDVVVEREGITHRAALTVSPHARRAQGRVVVPNVERWWPHTHGAPALYDVQLVVTHSRGKSNVKLGAVGFRTVRLDTANGDFAIHVNGERIFARGAVWQPLDALALDATPDALDRALSQITGAGMNMLRIPGTGVYENDAFLDACDARGIMLWQDFMFASMDYPGDDDAFRAAVELEVRQQLLRWQGRPCLTILCGNSEVDQQAAMWGAERELWAPPLFHATIAGIATEYAAGVPYVPSSATMGAFPHQPSHGATSYYGVGAYLHPLDDARRSDVRFASECLAFSNVPSSASLAASPELRSVRVHHPAWKARVPRDLGAGWDFEDVRDHYLARLFDVDAARLRTVDHARYLELSRVVTGEVMASALGEWRRAGSGTRGALVLSLRDLWMGAGWGVIASDGEPKPAWHFLRRAMAPLALAITDEGNNGLDAHVVNDTAHAFDGTLEVTLLRRSEIAVERATHAVHVDARGVGAIALAALFSHFVDLNHAYHFAPSGHDTVAVALRDSLGAIVARAAYFVGGRARPRDTDIGLTCSVAHSGNEGEFMLTLTTRRLAQWVALDVPEFDADDNYFHVFPGDERHIRLRARRAGAVPAGDAQPMNCEMVTRFVFA